MMTRFAAARPAIVSSSASNSGEPSRGRAPATSPLSGADIDRLYAVPRHREHVGETVLQVPGKLERALEPPAAVLGEEPAQHGLKAQHFEGQRVFDPCAPSGQHLPGDDAERVEIVAGI